MVIFCLQIAVLFFLKPFLTGTETAEAKNKVYDVGEGIIFHTISSASEGICYTICQPIRKLEETSVSLMGYCSW